MQLAMRGLGLDFKDMILDREAARAPCGVRVSADFANLGSSDAVDQTLHRRASVGLIRRISLGLYDMPDSSNLTGQPKTRSARGCKQISLDSLRHPPAHDAMHSLTLTEVSSPQLKIRFKFKEKAAHF